MKAYNRRAREARRYADYLRRLEPDADLLTSRVLVPWSTLARLQRPEMLRARRRFARRASS